MKLSPIFNCAQALPALQASMLPLVQCMAMGACRDQKVPQYLWRVIVNKIIEEVIARWHQCRHQCKASVWIYSIARICV